MGIQNLTLITLGLMHHGLWAQTAKLVKYVRADVRICSLIVDWLTFARSLAIGLFIGNRRGVGKYPRLCIDRSRRMGLV